MIPSWVSANISENPRQGSTEVFSIFAPGENPSEATITPGFQPDDSENSRQGSDTWHWGRHHAKNLTPYLFAGRRIDSFSQLYNNRNRYYSPKVGRFTSRDPIGFNGGNYLFAYANLNPVIYTDPFGELSQWVIPVGGLVIWGLLETGAWMAKIKKECNSLQPGTGKTWSLPPALGILAGPTLGLLQYRPTVEEKEVLFKPEECFNPEHRFGFPAGNCYYQIIYTGEKPPTGEPPKPIPGEF